MLAGLTIAVGLAIAYEATARPSQPDLGLIAGVMQLVQSDYVHPVSTDELTNDALKGMLSRLDPHSAYMTEQEFKESEQDLDGKFGGIGVEIAEHNGLPTVISPIDGTPAVEGGLQPGDMIVAIDGHSTNGADLMQVVTEIRGNPGTTVRLTISRGTAPPFDVEITRRTIQVHSVKARLEDGNIGYVRISQFGQDTPSEFTHAISKLKQDAGGSLHGLVLDLRNDPGGLLSAAVAVSGNFLDGGTVVSLRGRDVSSSESFKAPAKGDLLPHTPIVVLINGASASASEIVAGALQDRRRATLMGTRSFGKGSVQTVIPLKGHGAVRLTTALYYTPSGRSIQDDGVSPDLVVDVPKDQQVAESLMWGEKELSGALQNPGPLRGNGASSQQPSASQVNSPPIQEQLIGKPEDAQLVAAVKFLKEAIRPNVEGARTRKSI